MSNPRVSLFEDKKKGEKLNKLELNISTILAEISGQNSNIEYNPDDPFPLNLHQMLHFNIFLEELKNTHKLKNQH